MSITMHLSSDLPSKRMKGSTGVFVAALAALAFYYRKGSAQEALSQKVYPVIPMTNVLNNEEMELVKKLTYECESYYTHLESNYVCEETMLPKLADGSCPRSFMIERNASHCFVPNRFDSMKPNLLQGGPSGLKKPLDKLFNAFSSYIRFWVDDDELAEDGMWGFLFENEQFQKGVADVCTDKFTHRIPLQVNILPQVPGQSLSFHYDLGWFSNGATRHNVPHYFLIAMKSSGLFNDFVLPVVQGVTYIHDKSAAEKGGEFLVYNKGWDKEPVVVTTNFNDGIVFDGTQSAHGSFLFMEDHEAPDTLRSGSAQLAYNETTKLWDVSVGPSDKIVASYPFEHLRISLVWRVGCFESPAQAEEWQELVKNYDYEEALQVFEDDLRRKGILGPDEPRPHMVDFSNMVVNHYVQYPTSPVAKISINYCLFPDLVTNSWAKSTLRWLLSPLC